MNRALIRALVARGVDVTNAIGEQLRRLPRLRSEVPVSAMRNRVELLSSWG